MKYLCLVYPPEGFAVTPAIARRFLALRQEMRDAGVFVDAGQLQPTDSATTIRLRDGEPVMTDGPFAEMKEHVGGYVLLDCPDLDEAVRWSSRLMGVENGGAAEIRPLVQFPD